jgi:hypothetical protein
MGTNQLVARRGFEVLVSIVAAVLGTALMLFAALAAIYTVGHHQLDVYSVTFGLLAIVLGGLLFVAGLWVRILLSLLLCALIVA